MVNPYSKAGATVILVAIGLLLMVAIQNEDSVECVSLVRPVRMLRDPMPWEGEYFDPTYHKWPKTDDDKKAKRFVSDETIYAGSY